LLFLESLMVMKALFIGGTGTITNTGRMRIRSGNKFIEPSADLSKPAGDVYIENNLTVTNHGTIFLGGNVWTDWNTVYWVNAAGATLTLGNEFFPFLCKIEEQFSLGLGGPNFYQFPVLHT